jgi:parallel beta-helix repeat protein
MRDAVRAHLSKHSVRVRVGECLQSAIDSVRTGATVYLDAGCHVTLVTLQVHTRMRLSGPLGTHAIVVMQEHTVLRTSARVHIDRLFVCYLGTDTFHYPLTAIESVDGTLVLRECIVISRSRNPACGVWVGVRAHVVLDGCIVTDCAGPGLRVDRGSLVVRNSEIARSNSGGNVVIRGGSLHVHRCHIHNASGDGIALWSHVHATIENSTVYSNRGCGVSCHSCSLHLTNNVFYNNVYGSVWGN